MSLNTFPTLPGLAWDIKKRLVSSTHTDMASGGQEFRISRFGATPLYEFEIVVHYLNPTDRTTLENFFINQQGPAIPFNLNVTNDAGNPYIVRFKDDYLEFNQMLNGFYEVKAIKFRTAR